jgi:DNA-binding transcriptional MerR regulator
LQIATDRETSLLDQIKSLQTIRLNLESRIEMLEKQINSSTSTKNCELIHREEDIKRREKELDQNVQELKNHIERTNKLLEMRESHVQQQEKRLTEKQEVRSLYKFYSKFFSPFTKRKPN